VGQEHRDRGERPRLSKLRGHASAALHLLEAVTHLVHFVERHESGMRHEATERRIAALVDRTHVRDITLNHLLYWATQIVRRGRPLAEDLLPSYTNVQVSTSRSATTSPCTRGPRRLIVGIVNRYGTPVEMEIEGHKCNAASILELMVAVGSHPNARRFRFRGDEKPLRDIELLFQQRPRRARDRRTAARPRLPAQRTVRSADRGARTGAPRVRLARFASSRRIRLRGTGARRGSPAGPPARMSSASRCDVVLDAPDPRAVARRVVDRVRRRGSSSRGCPTLPTLISALRLARVDLRVERVRRVPRIVASRSSVDGDVRVSDEADELRHRVERRSASVGPWMYRRAPA
jgi:hypothetical protein